MVCAPSLSTDAVILQLPLPSAVVVPIWVVPSVSNNATDALASVLPVKVGVVSLVMLSVLELPLSLPAARSGVEPLGAVVSIMTALDPANELPLPSAGKVRVAAVVPSLVKLIVPPFRLNAAVLRYSKSALVSPACTR